MPILLDLFILILLVKKHLEEKTTFRDDTAFLQIFLTSNELITTVFLL